MVKGILKFQNIVSASCGLALFAASLSAFSQQYPSKPVRLVVGFAPGGTTDTTGRVVAQALTERLRQQVIVDNRPGAASNIATEVVVRAVPDGYTLLVMTVTQTVNASLYKNLAYDIRKDLAPISQLVTAPHVLVVHPSLPAKNAQQLIGLAKSSPGQLNFANAGSGSTAHLAAVLFGTSANIDVVHIPYKGTSPAMTELLAGQTQVMFSDMIVGRPHVIAGRLRALATSMPAGKRSALMPELPTISESGLSGFESGTWVGVLAPAQTPKPIIDRLNAEMAGAFNVSEIKKKMNELGMEVVASSPESFRSNIRKDVEKWAGIVKHTGLSVN